MSYHDTTQHSGRKSTVPPAKRSRQISVQLSGGPRDGDLVNYGQPLPKTLVLSSKRGYVDYVRKSGTTIYTYNMKENHA